MPSLGSLLRGITIPPVGGDTMFTNMYLAYDTLSDGMKKLLDGLHGIHTGTRKVDDPNSDREKEQKKINPPIAQPVVRVHPETGRKALYIGEKVSCFVDMTPEESRPLIDYLVKHATRPQFVYRHQWKQDDIILWDNRLHHAHRAGRLPGRRDPSPRAHHGEGHAVGPLPAMRRAFLKGLAAAALVPGFARAQAYPDKQIRMVIPFAPGGTTDLLARAVGQHMQETWGQVVVADKPRRCQRRGGGRDCRQGGARRIHALDRGDGPRHQSADLQEAAVRRRQRLHAGQPARDLPAARAGPSVGAGKNLGRADRSGEEVAQAADLWLGRQWLLAAIWPARCSRTWPD